MKTFIDHLFNYPHHIHLVADWIYSEFWSDKTGYSAATFESLLRRANDPNAIPLSLLGFVEGQPAGTINLIENDDERRPHLHPWLAALIVSPEYRGQGVGTSLIRALVREARRLGFSQMFLGTDQPSYYARLGAEFYEQASETLSVMRLSVEADLRQVHGRRTLVDVMAQIVATVRANGVSDESLAQVVVLLASLSAEATKWQDSLRPAQAGEEMLYELSSHEETGISLYLVSDGPGSVSPPHEHQTWAVIAGSSGVELNRTYARLDASSRRVVEVQRIPLGSGDTLVLTEGAIHATEVVGDKPTYHLHLYGKPLSSLPASACRTFEGSS